MKDLFWVFSDIIMDIDVLWVYMDNNMGMLIENLKIKSEILTLLTKPSFFAHRLAVSWLNRTIQFRST